MKPTHIHGFTPSETAPDYEVCEACGSLHRIKNTAPADVYASSYWNREGHSTIREQVHNVAVHIGDNGLTKCQSMMKHAGEGERALEIGCAPGSLLLQLRDNFKQVVGIECDSAYRSDILDISQGAASLVFGQFPDLSYSWGNETFDLVCAMDVFEHIEDGEKFMAEVLRILKPAGTVILMGPFLFGDGVQRDSDQHPEHLWLYSQQFLRDWFGEMFDFVDFDRWMPGHEILIAKGKRTLKADTKPEKSEATNPEDDPAEDEAPDAASTTTETNTESTE